MSPRLHIFLSGSLWPQGLFTHLGSQFPTMNIYCFLTRERGQFSPIEQLDSQGGISWFPAICARGLLPSRHRLPPSPPLLFSTPPLDPNPYSGPHLAPAGPASRAVAFWFLENTGHVLQVSTDLRKSSRASVRLSAGDGGTNRAVTLWWDGSDSQSADPCPHLPPRP